MLEIVKDYKSANSFTHGGLFHADDVVSAAILKEAQGNIRLCRVDKLPKNLPENAIIFDIGGGEFDHHQKGGNGKRFNNVPYASAGLIWRRYGMKYLRGIPKEQAQTVWKIVDRELIAGIDAVDNGEYPGVDYPVKSFSISAMISSYNPTWDSKESFDDAFVRAVEFAEGVLKRIIDNAISDVRAKDRVEQAIEDSENGIMVFETFVPWVKFIHHSRNPKAKDIMFAVFPSTRGGYMWQAVTEFGTRKYRKIVPEEWWGASPDELWLMTGANTATFCHPNGFCGGAELLEDAIKMAQVAITC